MSKIDLTITYEITFVVSCCDLKSLALILRIRI